jgi:8-oxo-dGTP pyrophosphatase MutT (NUDIX family)
MLPKLATLGSDRGVEKVGTRAAVAAILRERPGDAGAELFFIRRAEHPDDPWSGHIAFPGGRRDPEDESLLATAIRETREEVGIELAPEQLLGRLPDVPAFSRRGTDGLVVVPFVFGIRSDVAIIPNVEVAGTLWIPLATLARGDGRSTFKLDHGGTSYEMPCIHLEPGGHRLWGLTFRMLETLLETII